jgi:hypothetical protein
VVKLYKRAWLETKALSKIAWIRHTQ